MGSPNGAVETLPAVSNWPGDYNFQIAFSSVGHLMKKVEHTYSPQLKKLFVQKDVPCPVNFSTDYNMPIGTTIRATAVFSLPDHASDIVTRCVSHAVSDITMGILHPYHLVRSESTQALYETHPVRGHQSVVVPYANPHVGECCSTYIYKFVCWGSCAGGLNRRPITLVFTLENGGQVIGRQSVDVRICACPGRDRRTDEKNFETKFSQNPSAPRAKNPQEGDVSDILKFAQGVKIPIPRRTNIQPHTPDGGYIITATSRGMYDFLRQIEVLYNACNFLRDIPSQVQRIALGSRLQSSKRSLEESEESH